MGVPSNMLVPFVGVEFDNSRASKGPAVLNFQTLIFGQKTSAGTGSVDSLIKVSTADQVGKLAGFGSQPHQIAKKYFKNNSAQDTYMYLLADASGSTAAAYTITITATTAKAGELDIYIDGYRIPVSVAVDDDQTDIAAAIAGALNAELDNLPITTATATLGVVAFGAKNKGTVANGLDVRFNYYDGEVIPEGVTAAFAVATPGTVDPTVEDLIENIGDEWFQIFVGPYTDSTNLGLLEDELIDRAGVIRQIDGVYLSARKGDDQSLINFSTSSDRNCQYVAVIACDLYPNSVGEIAGAVAGKIIGSLANDAAKPIHRLALAGILAPAKVDRAKIMRRNSLALKGLFTLDPSNGVQTEACVSMWQKNASGAPDTSYQQLNSVYTLMVLRYRFRTQILSRYPNAKLADDVGNIGPGQQIITPAIGRAEAVAWFQQAEFDGLVENFDQFKKEVICVRDSANRNRLNWNLPPDLMNQFIVGSANLQFQN